MIKDLMTMWLNEETLAHLQELSKKFVVPDDLPLNAEETQVLTRIREERTNGTHADMSLFANCPWTDIETLKPCRQAFLSASALRLKHAAAALL